MKKILFSLLFTAALLAPAMTRADEEMDKRQAANYLKTLLKQQVKTAAQERVESDLQKINPGATKLYKKMAAVISNSELAASICWDLIKLGLQTNRGKFANEFAIRLRKYIPEEYKLGADALNPLLLNTFGTKIPTEADCTTILRELGKNTYDAITRMSGAEKQKAMKAGASIEKFGALMMSIGGSTSRQWQNQFRR